MVDFCGAEFVDFLALGEFGSAGERGFGRGFLESVGLLLGCFELTPAVQERTDLFADDGWVGQFGCRVLG